MAFEKRRYFSYSKQDHNTPVTHWAEMEHVNGSMYLGKPYMDNGYSYTDFFIWYDNFGIGWLEGNKRTEWLEGDLPEMVARFSAYDTSDKFIAELDRRAAEEEYSPSNWIGAREIEVARIIAPDRVEEYLKARKRHGDQQEAKHKAAAEKRERENAAFVEEQNRKAAEQVAKAVEVFKNGGEFKNDQIDIYKDRYDCSCYSLVNHLANIYGVSIPVKVKGWIADNLYSVKVDNSGRVSSVRLNDGKRQSTTIFGYLKELRFAIAFGREQTA